MEVENDLLTAAAQAFLLYLRHHRSIAYTYRTRL